MATPVKRASLEEILLKRELLSPAQLDECLQQTQSTLQPLRTILLQDRLARHGLCKPIIDDVYRAAV